MAETSINAISNRINYIIGAVNKMEKIDEETVKVEIFDNSATFICKKAIGLKVGCGYKIGIKDTEVKNQYEIVSIEQHILKSPAFKIQGEGQKVVQIPFEDYKNLTTQRETLIRECCLKDAIDIISKTSKDTDLVTFKNKTISLARELEQYFE